MPITPEQAKIELAKRELVRRQSQQQPQQPQPEINRMVQGGMQATDMGQKLLSSLIGGMIQPPVKVFGRAGQAIESFASSLLSGKQQPPINYNIPLPQSLGGNIPIEQAQSLGQAMIPAAETGLMMASGPIVEKGAALASNVAKNVINKADKISSRIVNSLITPRTSEFIFGNAGRGIAREKIVASSMEDLAVKTSKRLDDLEGAIKQINSLPENIEKNTNLSKSLEPLIKVKSQLSKAPKAHATEIKRLDDILDDLTAGDIKNLDNINISIAQDIKKTVSGLQDWSTTSKGGNEINKAIRQVYHNIDSEIDVAIPELKSLNQRFSDLISAKHAIAHRLDLIQKTSPIPENVWQTANLPFKLYQQTSTKTLLGKLLAKKYADLPQDIPLSGRFFKSAGGMMGTALPAISALPNSLEARKKYPKDFVKQLYTIAGYDPDMSKEEFEKWKQENAI